MAAAESYPDDLLYNEEHDWARIEGDEAVLGIDFDIPRCVDIPDATKVFLEGDRITRISKGMDVTIVEIGGPDRISYRGLMEEYARQRGLRRLMIPVPFLTPNLSSLWLGLVTPVYPVEITDGQRAGRGQAAVVNASSAPIW